MNKSITTGILVTILCAMGIVLFTHIRQAEPPIREIPPANSLPANTAPPIPQQDQGKPSTPGLVDIPPPLAPQAPVVVSTLQPTGEPLRQPTAQLDNKAANATVQGPVTKQVERPPVVLPPAQAPALLPEPKNLAPSSPKQEAQLTPKLETLVPPPVVDSPPLRKQEQTAPAEPKPVVEAPKTEPTATPTKKAEADRLTLRNISLAVSGQQATLHIEADAPFECKSFILPSPDRLVLDCPGTWTGMRAPNVPQNSLVKGARLGQQPTGPRLVLDMAQPVKSHKVTKEGNNTVQVQVR